MINDEIRDKEIRLIDADGAQLGIVSTREAQKLADEKQLDLVKIAPTAKPPVCKIMDYNRYRFESSKKEKEARKKQKIIEVKEIRLSPNIDTHDINVRIKQAVEFLREGNKVKVGIRFRYGREMGRTNVAQVILLDFAKAVDELGSIEKPPTMEARNMTMLINPRQTPPPKPQPKPQEQPPAQKTGES